VSSIEEALFCNRIGVEALGFTLDLPDGPHDDLTTEKAREIIGLLPPDILPVVITYHQTSKGACRLVTTVGGNAVQFHAGICEDQIGLFRELCPRIRTIARVTVRDDLAIAEALQFRPPLWDAIILDSFDPRTGRHGATGLTHDWTISARIVERSHLPVILAGGLTPENVRNAIRQVRPLGVDVHTGVENIDGSRDLDKIRSFTRAALEAFRELKL
jgi:phosphoribosylanthranilate isomerase